jgi:hypothetical protein
MAMSAQVAVPAVPAAASELLRPLVAGPPAAGRVVAAFPGCVYADLGGRLLAVEAADGLGLPCAVTVAAGVADRPFAAVSPGQPASTADGVLRVGPQVVRVARWWRPARPRGARPLSPYAGAPDGWDELVLNLLGLGPGLTPAGDDLLAGLLVGLAARPDLRDPLAAAVARHAPARTTWLSAELLRLAADGYAVPAVVAVADALAGHGTDDALDRALPALLAVGHTSGAALARGLLLAAETLSRHPTTVRSAA